MLPARWQSQRWQLSWAACFAGAAVLATLVISSVLILYACPLCDDYGCANNGRLYGCCTYAKIIYRGWSGRWASTMLLTGVLGRIDLTRSYPILLGGFAFFNVLGLVAF